MEKMKVCVIGAGAAGLCAARHLAANSGAFEFVVFEKSRDIGGTWVYTDSVGLGDDGLPVHSSIYKNLRTNLPKEIMSFPDFPEMRGESKSCVSHENVLDYLKEYARNFNLRQYIQFGTLVERVRLLPATRQCCTEKWKVRLKNASSSDTREENFDAILVCNGHYSEPYVPSIPGISNFHGQTMHSHDYRVPEAFTGKTVMLLGASSSGIDIAFELAAKASQVFLCHGNERLGKERDSLGFDEVHAIERYEDGAFVLTDGERLRDIDVLLFCTGYRYSYPFLDESCAIQVHDNHVTPLYKHLINVEHPTMCLVGIPLHVVPFPMFHVQIKYFISLLKEESRLPSKTEMLEDAKSKTSIKRHAHKLGSAQWAYNELIARAGNFDALPTYYQLGYEAWSQRRKRDLKGYKLLDLVVGADGTSVRIVGASE